MSKYFPSGSIEQVVDFISKYNICLKIKHKRIYKLGDYKPPAKREKKHHITVNSDLNPYSTLLVFLHELGHLLVWNKHKNRVKPHGKEWKTIYGQLINIFIEKNVFPLILKRVLEKNMTGMKAGFSSNSELFRTLALYDNGRYGSVFLEEIPDKCRFKATNGKTFVKQNKLRKRFRCFCLENHRTYLFHPLARIKPLNNET